MKKPPFWILPRIHHFPPKDINAMLKSILVTTANGKLQTASSRLPFAVNAMLKVPSDILVSYDVSSLFTNVPLDETIWILVEKAFTSNWFNESEE